MERKMIGQMLAAASVVMSLLFVGFEIRQNTAVASLEAGEVSLPDDVH